MATIATTTMMMIVDFFICFLCFCLNILVYIVSFQSLRVAQDDKGEIRSGCLHRLHQSYLHQNYLHRSYLHRSYLR